MIENRIEKNRENEMRKERVEKRELHWQAVGRVRATTERRMHDQRSAGSAHKRRIVDQRIIAVAVPKHTCIRQ